MPRSQTIGLARLGTTLNGSTLSLRSARIEAQKAAHGRGVPARGRQPFSELFHFETTDLIFGPEVSDRLAHDFANWGPDVKGLIGDVHLRIFEELQEAFTRARETGAVAVG